MEKPYSRRELPTLAFAAKNHLLRFQDQEEQNEPRYFDTWPEPEEPRLFEIQQHRENKNEQRQTHLKNRTPRAIGSETAQLPSTPLVADLLEALKQKMSTNWDPKLRDRFLCPNASQLPVTTPTAPRLLQPLVTESSSEIAAAQDMKPTTEANVQDIEARLSITEVPLTMPEAPTRTPLRSAAAIFRPRDSVTAIPAVLLKQHLTEGSPPGPEAEAQETPTESSTSSDFSLVQGWLSGLPSDLTFTDEGCEPLDDLQLSDDEFDRHSIYITPSLTEEDLARLACVRAVQEVEPDQKYLQQIEEFVDGVGRVKESAMASSRTPKPSVSPRKPSVNGYIWRLVPEFAIGRTQRSV